MKSRNLVADHGEVFTPAWLVDATLDHVKDESERIDSRFLEPACGSGNFIIKDLQRKLAVVERKFGKSELPRDFQRVIAESGSWRRLDVLTGSWAFSAEGSLFAHLGKHEICMPTKTYPPMTVSDLADTKGG